VTRSLRRAREGAGPLAGAGEASFRAEPATERGLNPVPRSILSITCMYVVLPSLAVSS